MLWTEDKTFLNEVVKLDFTRWKNCTFIGCTLILKYGETDLLGCKFDKCTLILAGPAIPIMKISSVFYPTIPIGKNASKDQKWTEKALNWINKKNPETVKKWVYETIIEAEVTKP